MQNFADLWGRKIRCTCMDAGRGAKVSREREIFLSIMKAGARMDGSVNGDFLRLRKARRLRGPAVVCLCRPMESSGEAAFEFCGRSRGGFLQIEFARAAPVVDVDPHFQRRTGAVPRSALRLLRRPFVLTLAF